MHLRFHIIKQAFIIQEVGIKEISNEITKFKKIRIPFYKLLQQIVDQQQKEKKSMLMTKNGVPPNSDIGGNFTKLKFENESQNSWFHKLWNLKI